MSEVSKAIDVDGTITDRLRPVTTPTAEEDPLSARMRTVWTSGDFDLIAKGFEAGAAAFIERLGLAKDEKVLDVACGTGNLALPAARAGAQVTGVDIAPNLLATAREYAAAQGLDIWFDEGNAEDLPYPTGAFDTAVTMFGAMFAPRPDRAAAELLRVVRPGGRIAMANWTAEGFVGQMLKAHVVRVPPPAGVPSTLLWGKEETVRERLAGAKQVTFVRRDMRFTYPCTPKETAELFRDYYGPTVRTYAALGEADREAFMADLEELWTRANKATDGTTLVDAEFLEVLAIR